MGTNKWKKNSWRSFPIQQQPAWPDKTKLDDAINKLKSLPALVFSGETRNLSGLLKTVNSGNGFILQIGNCAEDFNDCNGPIIHNFLRILLQMANVLGYNGQKNIIKIGRIAGQYAKPRSSNSFFILR